MAAGSPPQGLTADHLHALLSSAPDAYLLLAPDPPRFTVVAVTGAYLKIRVARREHLVGRGLFEVLPDRPADGSQGGPCALRASLERVVERGEPDEMPVQRYDVRNERGELERRHWKPLNTPAFDASGRLTLIIHRIEDVTRTHVADAWRRTLESVVTTANDAVVVTEPGPLDRPGPRIVYVNEGFVRMTGYQPDEVVGQSPRILQGPGTEREATARMRAALERREPVRVEVLNYKKDGTPFHVDVSISPAFDAAGELAHFIAVQRDMTERKAAEATRIRLAREQAALAERVEAEKALRASERLLNAVIDLMPVAVWIVDCGGKILRANPASRQLWGDGLTEGSTDLARRKGWRVGSGEPIAPDDWPLARALTRGETTVGQLMRVNTPDGRTRTILNAAMPLYDESQLSCAVVVHQDVTQLADTEDALREAVRARQEVLGIVAHDLRNPLNSIAIWLQVLKRRSAEAGDQNADVVEKIGEQVTRLDRLVRDLLDVASIDAGVLAISPSRTEIEPLVRKVVEVWRGHAEGRSVALALDLRGPLDAIEVDPDRLAQVLDNLLGNAIKFSPIMGRVTVGAEPRSGEIAFWVSDTGAGIPEHLLPCLFERFWRADRSDKRGAGLGLAIVKGIVESHGGRVWAESQVGAGTTIRFSLPRR